MLSEKSSLVSTVMLSRSGVMAVRTHASSGGSIRA